MKKLILCTVVLALFGSLAAKAADAPEGKKKIEEILLKRYDKNGDGKLDDEEKAALKKDREEQVKKYDKNGDGKLDDEERAAMRADLKKKFEGRKKKAE